ncbi:MAG: glycosyltransferase family 2 protein [Verrucomicrobiota bacterium]|nr:glycosyltransferase family 2 protein [Verrucomicrobiota bacterium]
MRALLPKLASVHEVIVVEASPDAELPRGENVTARRCAQPSRGKQMNEGAAAATGDVLVFLHADTEIEATHLEAIGAAMANESINGGAFYRQFDERHPHLRCFEFVARFLTRHGGTLFGDQTLFVRREVFRKLGGFAEIPLMEDVEFSRRLRAAGPVAVLDPPIRTSPRHHIENGAWRTTIRNALFLLFYKLGVSAETLHRIYYARRAVACAVLSAPTDEAAMHEVR